MARIWDLISQRLAVLDRITFTGRSIQVVPTAAVAAVASTANIGVVGSQQKLLAAMYQDTTTNLGAGAVFTGTARDTQVATTAPYLAYGKFQVGVVSDLAGTVYIDASTNGTNWYPAIVPVALTTMTDSDGTTTRFVANVEYNCVSRYVRLKVKNTAGTTSVLSVWSRVIGD